MWTLCFEAYRCTHLIDNFLCRKGLTHADGLEVYLVTNLSSIVVLSWRVDPME